MFSALSGPYGLLIKLGGMVLLAVFLFGFGFYEGDKHVTTLYKAKIVDHIMVQTKYLPQEIKYIQLASQHVDTNHEKAKANVETHPANPVCDVPADTVVLLNANRGGLPASK